MIPGKDVSVVGFDNRELSNYYKPPLTTTELPLYEIGYTACANVIEEVEADSEEYAKSDQIVEIPKSCKLLIRQSVKDIREA